MDRMEDRNAQSQLNELAPKLRAHVPLLGEAMTALLPELRLAEKFGLMSGRSRLGIDKDNLTRDARDLLAFREELAQTEDTKAAEEALIALVADMRVRIAALLKERASAIRVNSEVSAHRADPAAVETMDLTDGFRLMAAHPTPIDVDVDGLIVQNLGLPAAGGKAGRILGDVRFGRFFKAGPYYDAAPIETFFLPAGRSVRLMPGEQIRLHICGRVSSHAEINLDYFGSNMDHMDVEAVGEDVEIHGPATFALSQNKRISEVLADIETVKSSGVRPHRTSFLEDANFDFLLPSLYLLPAACGILLALLEKDMQFLVGIALSSPPVAYWAMKKIHLMKRFSKVSRSTRKSIEDAARQFYDSAYKSGALSAPKLLEHAEKTFAKASALRFYPARRIIVSDRVGVKEIEPLVALPSPIAFKDNQVIPIRKTQGERV